MSITDNSNLQNDAATPSPIVAPENSDQQLNHTPVQKNKDKTKKNSSAPTSQNSSSGPVVSAWNIRSEKICGK